MAYRRSLAIRSNFIGRRFNPSFSYAVHDDDDRKQPSFAEGSNKGEINKFLQHRFFGNNVSAFAGIGAFPSRMGFDFHRHMSTSVGGNSDKVELISDVAAEVISQIPVVSEVAVAAAESAYPVAALQYLIDAVHSATGFNWWVSIALTSLLIRGATIPFLINQLKATTKLTIMRPKLDEIQEEMKNKGMDPEGMAEGKRKMNLLFNEYGVTPFTPIKGLLIQGPVFVSFFLGISNMAEKVPSFKHGGAFWFTDLTTPDTLYILPVLTALTFLITVEFNMQEGLEGNPIGGTMKKVSRGLAVLTVPLTMHFPKAIFCYWVTSNLFSLVYGLVIKRPNVKKFLGIPKIPPPPPGTVPKPAFTIAGAYKQYMESFEKRTSVPAKPPAAADPPVLFDRKVRTSVPAKPPVATDPPVLFDRKVSVSPSSAINQKIRTLEKQVKAKKKNKKRSG